MAQIFHPSLNVISKMTIFGALIAPLLALVVVDQLARSQYATGEQFAVEQPVPFSHQHHVEGLGLDCRMCHTSVEDGAVAGVPPATTCAKCHNQVWKDAPMLAPVLASAESGLPIRWRRVHDLPDFVRFDHSRHLAKGVGCASCHGRVDKMPLVWRTAPLTMDWCLDCHNNPAKHLRPRSALFDLGWKPPANLAEHEALAASLMKTHKVKSATHCSACHR